MTAAAEAGPRLAAFVLGLLERLARLADADAEGRPVEMRIREVRISLACDGIGLPPPELTREPLSVREAGKLLDRFDVAVELRAERLRAAPERVRRFEIAVRL